MEPPSPTKPGSRPKRSLETAESVAAMPGSSGGAIHPSAAASMSMVHVRPFVGPDGRDQGIGRHLRIERRGGAGART